MKNIISAVVVVLCIVAGGIGGHFLKSGGGGASGPAAHAEDAADDGHGKSEESGHAKPEKAKSGHGDDSSDEISLSGVDYFKFSREFVVPIMRDNKVVSLVILNINLEVDSSLSRKLFSMEPKIRDNIMTTLVELSNDGRTLESVANLENYESIRSTVLMNLQKVAPAGIRNVLIVDMAKQDL
ncbi:flagellar basal body-associated FliL family protein [Hyphomonas johnsonii]|nr:flagellar basal body-associated FliL family protein [Hyphomonas johnsonii]